MSITHMAAAWKLNIGATEKIVLLALADHANDDGYCWPGNASLCTKCGLSERAVRNALGWLESNGHITRHFVTGKSTSYHVHPGTTCPRQDMPPAPRAATPAPRAPKPSRNTRPSSSDDGKKERARINRGMRLPADWQPKPLPDTFGVVPAGMIKRELSKFRDYWAAKAGAGGVKLDWDATWRNWMRTAMERNDGQRLAAPTNRNGHAVRPSPSLDWIERNLGRDAEADEGAPGVYRRIGLALPGRA